MAATALGGIRVLDLSSGVAGPYCTRLLAGLGAEVVKVEPPGGDYARRLGPFLTGSSFGKKDKPGLDHSALFHHLNAGKKSVVLDIQSDADRSTIRSLATRSQILVECFPPGVMADLGLGYESLCRDNPKLVMTSISDFGQNGPYRDFHADEIVHLALGGLLYTTGEPDREPLALAGHQASYLAGLNATIAAVAGLCQAEVSGRGSHIDVSILESVVSVLEATTVLYSRDGVIRRRQGNRHGRSHPTTILPCRDGYIGVMLGGDADWDLFAAFTGLEGLADPRFATVAGRLASADEIDAIVRPWLMTRTRRDLFHSAQELRLPLAMVLSPEEVMRDAQHRRRKFFSTVDHPVVGKVTLVGPPFRMSSAPWISGRAPTLDEHREEVITLLSEGHPQNDGRAGFEKNLRHGWGSDENRDAVLAGVRVLDLTAMWAGPLCTRVLADLGAEVIKIESPTRIDGTRANPGYFNWLNRNKLSLTLDLGKPQGAQLFRRLVGLSDVVVESFTPRVMPNFGLDYRALRAANPSLIMLSMPAYGSTGPYRNYVAYGPGIEAMSGLSWLTGYEDGPPMLSGSAYADPVAGLHGALAILAALRYRRLTGEGQWIDLAQRECLTQMIGEYLVLAGAGRQIPPRSGNRHPARAPHGCYRCAGDGDSVQGKDEWVAISVADDEEWKRLCRALGEEALGDDPRFRTAQARKADEDELDQIIEGWTRQRGPMEATRLLQAAGVAAGAVLNGEALSRDEHLMARGFFVSVADADGKVGPYPGVLWKTAERPEEVFRPAPRLGQHNRGILGGLLRLTTEEIDQLERDEVIASELQDRTL